MTLSQIHTCRRKESISSMLAGRRGGGGRNPGKALTCTPSERLVGIEHGGEKAKGKSTNTK